MSTTIHCCINLRGALTNWNPKFWRGCVTDNGKVLTPAEVHAKFLDYLSEGKRVIPFGDCPTFDYQTGCPGHETDAEPRP